MKPCPKCFLNLSLDRGSFRDPDQVAQVEAAIAGPNFKEVPVGKRFDVVEWDETWHQCLTCGTIYRFVRPDPPFTGVWQITKSPNEP